MVGDRSLIQKMFFWRLKLHTLFVHRVVRNLFFLSRGLSLIIIPQVPSNIFYTFVTFDAVQNTLEALNNVPDCLFWILDELFKVTLCT